ncbi:hypothetical protein HYQ44_010172 [Verticillium longisporum]|nr:hypothetical protein HYQ44_010172 [Verticillium longisporum]
MASIRFPPKRLIVCCDGTWFNCDDGYNKPIFGKKRGALQVPSNVTRISRCFKRTCDDGRVQIVNYQSGIGTGSNTADTLIGGAFGSGISMRIKEAYSFLAANYFDGDEIILIGFSRGAFTARSVAGIISKLGLLTREGVEMFYPIFKDMQNWKSPQGGKKYRDKFPDKPFSNKPHGDGAAEIYRARLEAHAFQALALDETRSCFQPAVWERLECNRSSTDLRQVWFAGSHNNIGGGELDQAMADITLAWMMDQLASVNVEFDEKCLERVVAKSMAYYTTDTATTKRPWAKVPIYHDGSQVRPWALGTIYRAHGLVWRLAGRSHRSPGLNHATNPRTGRPGTAWLEDTNERVHASVRVRLACGGTDVDGKTIWACPALAGRWKLARRSDLRSTEAAPESESQSRSHWVWTYVGNEEPPETVLSEEPMGIFEEQLLELMAGRSVWEYAENASPVDEKH